MVHINCPDCAPLSSASADHTPSRGGLLLRAGAGWRLGWRWVLPAGGATGYQIREPAPPRLALATHLWSMPRATSILCGTLLVGVPSGGGRPWQQLSHNIYGGLVLPGDAGVHVMATTLATLLVLRPAASHGGPHTCTSLELLGASNGDHLR